MTWTQSIGARAREPSLTKGRDADAPYLINPEYLDSSNASAQVKGDDEVSIDAKFEIY